MKHSPKSSEVVLSMNDIVSQKYVTENGIDRVCNHFIRDNYLHDALDVVVLS